MIIKVPILAHYKKDIKTIMETNFFNYIINAVFFQMNNDRLLHWVTFSQRSTILLNITIRSIINIC